MWEVLYITERKREKKAKNYKTQFMQLSYIVQNAYKLKNKTNINKYKVLFVDWNMYVIFMATDTRNNAASINRNTNKRNTCTSIKLNTVCYYNKILTEENSKLWITLESFFALYYGILIHVSHIFWHLIITSLFVIIFSKFQREEIIQRVMWSVITSKYSY